MTDEETAGHIVSYPDVKEPQKPLAEKHASPRKAAVLCFNPDGSLCIPADLKEKLDHQANPSIRSGGSNCSKENHTPDSRKRKKNGPPSSTGKRKSEVWVKPPDGCCHFCYTNDVRKELGELRESEGVLAHHNCLLFSSGLCQAGKNDEGLWGFLVPHIQKEISRGKRLKCSFCRLPGALVGCHKARCSYTYHFTCGLNNGCLMQYYDNFRSFCTSHRPRQYFAEEMIGKTLDCAICGDTISVDTKVAPQEVLVTECCNMTPLHRQCLQNQADASGYFFRCPMCNNEKKFNSITKIMGINIPQSDAVWEKDGYYDDLYQEHWICDIPICLHTDGRKGDSRNNDQWDLMKCCTCGQAGAHPACLGYDKRGPKEWSCAGCVTFESKYEEEQLEAEKKRLANPEISHGSATASPGPSNSTSTATSTPSKATTPSRESSNKRSRRKTLSPSKDPFLMPPEVLKEAVFKLCVAKLKKDKAVKKDLNPDVWTGLHGLTSKDNYIDLCDDDDEDVQPYVYSHLKPRPFSLLLTKSKYTPPPPPPSAVPDEDDPDGYDEHKERLWELILKHRLKFKGVANKGVANRVVANKAIRQTRGRQMSINSFFKRRSRENYTADAKRRKIESSEDSTTKSKKSKVKKENEYEPFPFKRSPHQSPFPSPERSNDAYPLATSPTKPVQERLTLTITLPIPFPSPESECSNDAGYPLATTPTKQEATPVKSEVTPPQVPAPSPPRPAPSPPCPAPSPPSYKCYYCTDIFSKMSVRMDHMRSAHHSRLRGWDSSKGKQRSVSTEDTKLEEVIEIKDDDDDEIEVSMSFSESSSPIKDSDSPRKTPRKQKQSPKKQTSAKNETSKKGRGRPRKKRSVSGYSHEEEMMKYDELTIEVADDKDESEESADDEVEFVDTIFPSPKKKESKAGYDWTEGEIYSLIEYYSINPYLWDNTLKQEGQEEEVLIERLERKLGIPGDTITAKWKSLVTRYKQEKYEAGSTWKFLSPLSFLEEFSLTSCPEDVSPLFSLLTGADSQDDNEGDEVEELPNSPNNSQDIFPDLSDEERIEESDNEDKSSDKSSDVTCLEQESTCEESETMLSTDRFRAEGDFVTSVDEIDDAVTLQKCSFSKKSSPSKGCSEVMTGQATSYCKKPSPCKELPNLCSECGKTFQSRGILMQHKLKLRYFCCHCCKNFTTLASLKQHQNSLNTDLFICPFCHMFRNEVHMHITRHISDVHLKEWMGCECRKCGALYRRKEKSLLHVKQQHGVPAMDCERFVRVRDFRCLYD